MPDEITRGAIVTIQLDIPDLAAVRYERDVLDLISKTLPWDLLPDGTKLVLAKKTLYTIKNGAFTQGHPDVTEESSSLGSVTPMFNPTKDK